MAKFFLSNKALDDLSKIWDYTYQTWSERQADIYYSLLIDACQDLAEGNLRGKHYPEIGPELLGFKAGKHLIFYRIGKNENIEVARILHEQMDLKNRIEE
jgi:toxin ParE1/3/4